MRALKIGGIMFGGGIVLMFAGCLGGVGPCGPDNLPGAIVSFMGFLSAFGGVSIACGGLVKAGFHALRQ